MKKLVFVIPFLVFFTSMAQKEFQVGNTTLKSRTIIDTLNIPWEIHWGPDGYLWTTERYGRVSRIDPETGDQKILLDLSNEVVQEAESGMLGLTLYPDFNKHPWVYIVYTYGSVSDMLEKMVRYEFDQDTLINPKTIVDSIDASSTHDGSRLAFMTDTTLLMTCGDARVSSYPQDLSVLNGSILRFNDDGSIPSDNPISGSPLYTWGHRNPQGLAFSDLHGEFYISEHGPDSDDEFQLLKKGRNYGWPEVEGFCDESYEQEFCNDSNVVEPLINWTPTIAPSDISFYNHSAIPEFQNSVLLSVLKDKMIVQLKLNNNGKEVTNTTEYFNNEFGRLRDIEIAPDGRIFIATNGSSYNNNNPFTHKIIELKNKDQTTGDINNSSNNESFILYPNPANKKLVIKNNFAKDKVHYTLISSNGKNVLRGELNNKLNILDIKDLPEGIYIFKCNYFNKKVIIR